jgi:hypothetical protein
MTPILQDVDANDPPSGHLVHGKSRTVDLEMNSLLATMVDTIGSLHSSSLATLVQEDGLGDANSWNRTWRCDLEMKSIRQTFDMRHLLAGVVQDKAVRVPRHKEKNRGKTARHPE